MKRPVSAVVVCLGLFSTFAHTNGLLDNRFFSCRAANQAGIFNVPTPAYYVPRGWDHTSDRDGDGISCEPARKR